MLVSRYFLQIIAGLICFSGLTMGQNLIENGSFEDGKRTPLGWKKGNGGMVSSTKAHSGQRSLGGKTKQETVCWTSKSFDLEKGQSYRLSARLRTVKGIANLGMDVMAQDESVLETKATEKVEVSASDTNDGWQYVSIEHDMPEAAASARFWLKVKGEAYLDELIFVPLIKNLVFNPEFNGDRKNRVGFWDQDMLLVLPGSPSGSHAADLSGGRSDAALMVDVQDGWRAVRNLPAPLPDGITTFRLSGWARSESGEVEVLVTWLDDWANIIHIDKAEAKGKDAGWTEYVAENITVPKTAERVNATVIVRNGKAWFDDFELRAVSPVTNKQNTVKVFVNQVGYEAAGPKSLVVSSNFIPEKSANSDIKIVALGGKEVMKIPLVCSGRIHDGTLDDWGSYYWRADFSDLRPGVYKAIAQIGETESTSPTFRVADGLLFDETVDLGVEFFYIQRCGYYVPGWHGACHMDGAMLPDSTHIDATGGWHSAGDYNKLMYENGDGGVVYSLLLAYQADPDYFEKKANGLPAILDEAIWGSEFVAKMQNPQTGGLYKDVKQGPGRDWMKWCPPEDQTDNIVGTKDDPIIVEGEGSSPLVIGAWARLSALLEERGISNDYMDHALRLWDNRTDNGQMLGGAHLLISAVELYDVTGSPSFSDYARRSVENLLATQVDTGRMKGAFGTFGEYAAGALATFALTFPEDPLTQKIKKSFANYITFCESTADNPFGLGKQQVGVNDFYFEPTSSYGHNFEILIRAWAAHLIHKLTGDKRALVYATDQLDWVLGKNPFSLCMFEGKGTLNPPRYHHRYDSIPGHERGAVPGCVPNGFVRDLTGRDRPGFDMSRSAKERRRVSYRTSEPWLVHNMWYLIAISTWK